MSKSCDVVWKKHRPANISLPAPSPTTLRTICAFITAPLSTVFSRGFVQTINHVHIGPQH